MSSPSWMQRLRDRARALEADAYALALTTRDRRVPWYAKLLVGLVVAYALSPIDLIPDFIPVLGVLDDLLIVPAGIALAIRLIPTDVLEEYRATARRNLANGRPGSRLGAALVVSIWFVVALWLGIVAWRAFGAP